MSKVDNIIIRLLLIGGIGFCEHVLPMRRNGDVMMLIRSIALFLFVSACSVLVADGNIEQIKLNFSLSRNNRANVVRLKSDKGIVKYILEVYLDGWEIDGPDDQLGGSLCLRINRAGGRYLPGCLLCKPDAIKTYSPSDCYGIFSKEMLE